MRYEGRSNSYVHPVPANSKHNNDQSDTDVDNGGNVGDQYADQLARLNRFDVRAFAPRRRARPPISSAKIDPDSLGDRMPLFLEPDVPLSSEMYGAPRVRRRSFFSGLVLRTGAMMTWPP
jgi:hypothetical protein